jgi:hypothetical protein
MELHDAATRWHEGQLIPGVMFGFDDPVSIERGEHAGKLGIAVQLLRLTPEPVYLIEVEPDGPDLEVLQSQLGSV